MSIVILVTSAVATVLDACKVFRNLYKGGPTGIEYIAVWRQGYEATNVAVGIVSDAMLVSNIALGDALLVSDLLVFGISIAAHRAKLWRCFVLWKDRKWVIVIPALTCIVSVGA
jgi:hypothetical protein